MSKNLGEGEEWTLARKQAKKAKRSAFLLEEKLAMLLLLILLIFQATGTTLPL
jgi:hypothetical protein